MNSFKVKFILLILCLGPITNCANGGYAPGEGVAYYTPVLIQSPYNNGINSGVSFGVTSTGRGNLLVVSIIIGAAGDSVQSITDNAGNTYVSAGVPSTSNQAVEIWFAKNSIAGATSVTITEVGGSQTHDVWFLEFSGMNTSSPLDQGGVLNNQIPGLVDVAPTVNILQPVEVVISTINLNTHATGIVSGNPFTAFIAVNGESTAYSITSTSGIYGAQWTGSVSTHDNMSTASFKAAAVQ